MKTTGRKAELMARLGAILAELDAMPAGRLGTAWHADRCAEVRALAARLELMAD